jgi:hypothetical protein
VQLTSVFRRWQERRREGIAEKHAHLSDEERGEIQRLREAHDPLSEMADARIPPQFRDVDRW